MIRKQHYIRGRGTRYFSHNSGIVRDNRSILLSGFLPFLVVLGMIGAGSYYGYQYYEKSDPLSFSSQTSEPELATENATDDAFNLQSMQAKEDKDLAGRIKSKLKDMPDDTKWAVSVRDLNSGRMANVNADQKLDPAGLYKLFIFPSLDKRLSSDYWQSYIDRGHSVNECVSMMIMSDDDTCVNAFGYYVGWDSYNEYNKQLGFSSTELKADGTHMSTTRDVNEMMYRLQNSQVMSDKARRLVFDSLYDQQNPHGVKNICGETCLVASMVSERDEYKYESAVVSVNNASYVITIFSKGASWDQFLDVESLINFEMTP